MGEIERLIQKPFPGVEVEMFDLDLSSKGGPIMHFTNWVREDGTKIIWRGNPYDPVAIESDGFGVSGEGKPTRPKMTIGNSSVDSLGPTGNLSSLCAMYGDFVGCSFTRWRTYRQFLDDGESPDPSTHFPIEKFKVSAKLEETFLSIQWELAISIDMEGQQLPKGFMSQKHCPWTYRVWDPVAGAFDYTNVICPYAGATMFDENGNLTADPTQDKCSRRITSGCRKRFGTTAPLPIGAFPGMLRTTPRR